MVVAERCGVQDCIARYLVGLGCWDSDVSDIKGHSEGRTELGRVKQVWFTRAIT